MATEGDKRDAGVQQKLEAGEPVEEQYEEHSHHSSGSEGEVDEKARGESNGEPLEKKQSKASVNNYDAIPNGGLQAWLQVAGGFCLFFNSCKLSSRLPLGLDQADKDI